MRVVEFYKSALSRQVGEAIRIRRRGLTLNSKGEFNRCSIPRLTLGLDDDLADQPGDLGEDGEDGDKDDWTELMLQQRDEKDKLDRIKLGRPGVSSSNKRLGGEQESSTRRRKKKKYEVLEEDWGMTENEHSDFLYSGLEGVKRMKEQELETTPIRLKKSSACKALEKAAMNNNKISDWIVRNSEELKIKEFIRYTCPPPRLKGTA